ncbi:hypothetical protein EVJ58_g9275 [Rhodofomes roseus]|uniref:Uncharacterized protein n=1 Tax=Rhodofomes roseus TaxID=34475 RepID=A0A4Y9XUC8_9APHY|nr:hypothetical protein EVJ58_g9275 [Rhodofomes roseus]
MPPATKSNKGKKRASVAEADRHEAGLNMLSLIFRTLPEGNAEPSDYADWAQRFCSTVDYSRGYDVTEKDIAPFVNSACERLSGLFPAPGEELPEWAKDVLGPGFDRMHAAFKKRAGASLKANPPAEPNVDLATGEQDEPPKKRRRIKRQSTVKTEKTPHSPQTPTPALKGNIVPIGRTCDRCTKMGRTVRQCKVRDRTGRCDKCMHDVKGCHFGHPLAPTHEVANGKEAEPELEVERVATTDVAAATATGAEVAGEDSEDVMMQMPDFAFNPSRAPSMPAFDMPPLPAPVFNAATPSPSTRPGLPHPPSSGSSGGQISSMPTRIPIPSAAATGFPEDDLATTGCSPQAILKIRVLRSEREFLLARLASIEREIVRNKALERQITWGDVRAQ